MKRRSQSNNRPRCPLPRTAAIHLATALPLLLILASGKLPAQTPPHHSPPSTPAHATTPAAPDELTARVSAALNARSSGSPTDVASANALVIAAALRELAALRSVEGAYPQAVTLYKDSLSFEDSPAVRLDLATVDAQSGQYDDAVKLATGIHTSDPANIQADRILSSSLIQKGDFTAALDPLTRVAKADPSVDTQYALINCLLQTKRPADRQRALDVFQQLQKQHGDSGSLHVLMGRAFRDAGDLPAAVHEFERAIAIDPRTPHAHYFLGLAKLSLNEWRPTPESEAAIRKEAELYPHDYLANYMAGFLASGERQYDQAEPYLKAAAAINPSAPEPFLYMGLNAYAKSDNKTAEEMLRKAVDLTGSDEARSNYQIRRAYVDLGRILATSGRTDESEVFLNKARDLQNKTMEQSQQSIARMTAGSPSMAAVVRTDASAAPAGPPPQINEAARLDPSSLLRNTALTDPQRTQAQTQEKQLRSVLALAYNDLATSEAIRGQYADAFGHYARAEEWDNTLAGLAKNLGQSAFRAGDFQGAIPPLTRALREAQENPAQPNSDGLRAMLGISCFNTNRFAEAAQTFAPLGPAGMQDGEVGYAWAASLARTGDVKKATEVLEAYAASPRPPDVTLLIGQLWTAIGDYPRAISTLQQALAADPSLPKAHFYAGLADIHSERWTDAAREFQAELAINPGDPDALYHLGFVDMQQSRLDDAVTLFQQVVAAHPEYANAQYELGKIQLDRGQVDSAITHLQAAEQSSPSTDYIHYQLQAAYRKASRPDDAEKELAIYKQLKADSRQHAADRANAH